MAPMRPEFFYHPAVGVVSPTSLGLFAFKQGPLVFTSAPPVTPGNLHAPEPFNRVPMSAVPEPTVLDTVSPVAVAAEISKIIEKPDMKKPKSDSLATEVCIVTGEELPIEKMIRFVVDPDQNVMPDFSEKLPVQGFWVTAKNDVLKKAIWRNSFTTAARSPVKVPKNLIEQIHLGLLKLSLETMSLARKAGLLTQGFAKCEDVLKEGKAALYIVASDAKENGREKLEKLTASIPVLSLWTSSQLSAALGSDNAIHVVLTAGGLTDKLLNLSHKLKDFK